MAFLDPICVWGLEFNQAALFHDLSYENVDPIEENSNLLGLVMAAESSLLNDIILPSHIFSEL